MKKSKLEKIRFENAQFEIAAPFNFCDRWCERCPSATKDRCSMYQERFTQSLSNVPEDQDPTDTTLALERIRQNFDEAMEMVEELGDEEELSIEDFDQIESEEEFKQRQRKEKELYHHALFKTSRQYMKKAHQFLKKSFYDQKNIPQDLIYHFETISWYQSLLPPKIHRFLTGLFVKDQVWDEESQELVDFGLQDAVAQMDICQKGLQESKQALMVLNQCLSGQRQHIGELLTILKHLESQIRGFLNDIDNDTLDIS